MNSGNRPENPSPSLRGFYDNYRNKVEEAKLNTVVAGQDEGYNGANALQVHILYRQEHVKANSTRLLHVLRPPHVPLQLSTHPLRLLCPSISPILRLLQV